MTAPQGGQPQGGQGTGNEPSSGPQGGQGGGQGNTPAGQPQGGETGGQQGGQTPPWGSDEQFDPQRAWNLIQNLRTEKTQAQQDRDTFKGKVEEFENAGKSETERLTGDRDTHKSRADTAEGKLMRLEIGLDKGLTPAQCARLVGSTEDELKADADKFLAELPSGSGQAPPSRRPRERMPSGGSDPEEPADEDPEKIAARVGRWR